MILAETMTYFLAQCLFLSSTVVAAPLNLTLEQVLTRMAEMDKVRAAALQHYTSVRRYCLDNKRFRTSAEMTVKMTFRQPGHKEFKVISEGGSATIRKRVLWKMIESELEAA